MKRARKLLTPAMVALSLMAIGCSDERQSAEASARDVLGHEAAPYVSQETDTVGFALTTLPTSGVIVAGKAGAVCYSFDGDEEWRFDVPAGDEIVASPAVAPDSSVYILTERSLIAISVKGEVLWMVDADPAEIPAVVALGDGTAVITSGANALVNFETGRRRWRFELPDGDTIASIPRASNNSQIFVQGTKRLYVVDPSGIPLWDQPL